MRSDGLIQNNVAEEAQAILNFTRDHISHTHIRKSGYRPIVPAARPDSGVGLTSHALSHTHTHPSLATAHVMMVLYAQPFHVLSLSVSNPCLSS